MLIRVWEIAAKAAEGFSGCRAVIATEDERIVSFCQERNMECVLTSHSCKTGTDRVREVISKLNISPRFIVNLQGDNPMCPPWFVKALIEAYTKDNALEVVTPCVRMSWEELSQLRESKKLTPFSGTTAVVDKDGYAIWFSKNIIPALRKEDGLRESEEKSPVLRHVGLYGYSHKALDAFASLPESYYEKLEGLEQLRFLENGMKVKVVEVDYKGYGSMSGVDSPEDIIRAEALFAEHGEFV